LALVSLFVLTASESPSALSGRRPLAHRRLSAREMRARRANVSFATPGFDFEFLLPELLMVGTPGVFAEVSIETGSNKYFLLDKSFPGSASKYDPDKSTTSVFLNDEFESATGGGAATGKTYSDFFSQFGFNWTQAFGVVDSLSGWDGHDFPLDGVFGYGWDPFTELEPNVNAPPLINYLYAGSNVKRPFFELEFGGGMYYMEFFVDGEGPVEKANLVPFVPSPLGIPVFQLDGFAVLDYKDAWTTPATLDTGFSVLALPEAQFRVVQQIVQPYFDWETGLYMVDCGDDTPRAPKLVFTIGGEEYWVRQNAYLLDFHDDDSQTCIFAVARSAESDPFYRLGLPFVRLYIASWDGVRNQMGFQRNNDEE